MRKKLERDSSPHNLWLWGLFYFKVFLLTEGEGKIIINLMGDQMVTMTVEEDMQGDFLWLRKQKT